MSNPIREQLLHTRQVCCRGYRLSDGNWEIEGQMCDLKNFPMANQDRGGMIAVGEPLHDLALSVVIDSSLRVLRVRARTDASPFSQCAAITGAFRALEGLTLTPGFNRQAKDLLGGVKGCTHLLELLGPIATTAYQTLWQSEHGYNGNDPAVSDFLINSCYALAEDGEVVQSLADELATLERHSTANA